MIAFFHGLEVDQSSPKGNWLNVRRNNDPRERTSSRIDNKFVTDL
ncbi:hypothetical protein OHAE_130 [Ochrobactrum soli]|uniref:Uncharacterized protein n=1 Tax=Ochrobactrum soli TaxID=2448455 RepID=A0A2P9HJV0_9HYPH|nr:hypothetical protein OHAE_130 [[Ochrobactrum] soli]